VLDRLRRIIATKTMQSFCDVPHFSINMDVRLDTLFERGLHHNGSGTGLKILINDLIIKAAALARL
jgi:pyruvate dehydrogenase E2 component (dihydrolipoamide acetyltransferase)